MMRVKNNTLWKTADLKRILQRAAEQELEPTKRKTLIVTVNYTRGGYSSGCAWIGGRHATVRIQHPHTSTARWLQAPLDDPRPAHGWMIKGGIKVSKTVRETEPLALTDDRLTEIKLRVASVAVHEFAHCRGMEHRQMLGCYKWSGKWRDYVAWAADMPLTVKAPNAKPKPGVEAKLAHVVAMRERAETRVKRATAILRRWRQRERYYGRKQAAAKVAP